MKIIGLTGPAGSGKSTVARILCEHHAFIEMSFAGPLRDFIQCLTGLSDQELAEHKEDPHPLLCGKSPRQAMQWLGTQWGRQLIGADLWIKLIERGLDEHGDYFSHIVISDVRFPNEASWIRERGELWHLTRPGRSGVNAHLSEAGVAICERDIALENDCDLDELVRRIADRIGSMPQ